MPSCISRNKIFILWLFEGIQFTEQDCSVLALVQINLIKIFLGKNTPKQQECFNLVRCKMVK